MELYEEFSLYENMWQLTEAKEDKQRLIDFAGEDLANRFLKLVQNKRLKPPENGIYYWIKNKSVNELELAILSAEEAATKSRVKKETEDSGAELISESEHWKVYKITTFEASQKYGRDSKWCITGINNWGDKYWNEYTSKGVTFNFLIAKQGYNPRGFDSKFAIAFYPNGLVEIFNQRDGYVATVQEIPYYNEVVLANGTLLDIDAKIDREFCEYCDKAIAGEDKCVLPDNRHSRNRNSRFACEDCWWEHCFVCDECDSDYYRDDGIEIPDKGIMLCDKCFEKSDWCLCDDCGEVIYKEWALITASGMSLCDECYDKLLHSGTVRSYAEMFYQHSIYGGDFEDIDEMINSWNRYKDRLPKSDKEIKLCEKAFIKHALEDVEIVIDPSRFIELNSSK